MLRLLILLAALVLVWRVATSGLSSHYTELLQDGKKSTSSKALAWNSHQPEALLHEAFTARAHDPDKAANLLAQAYRENPTDPRPLMAMADLMRDDQVRSEALVATAVDLAPSDSMIQMRAAGYWSSRGDLEQAMRHWSLAIETDPSAKKRLFPVLLELAEDPSTRPFFKPFAELPPSWWPEFFRSVAAQASDIDSVRALYAFRRTSSQTPVTEPERRAYVARMKKNGVAAEAYIHWINGLSREQRRKLGLIHDGGFELEPGDWGFGWRLHSTPTSLVHRAHTYGVDGDTALHLLFKNHRWRGHHVSQALFLGPDRYRLTGKVRTDALKTEGGLKWLVRCLLAEEEILGDSNRFLGSNEWREFAFEFEVPESCALQELVLVSGGKRAFEHKIAGDAWFDRLAVRRIENSTQNANPESENESKETAATGHPGPRKKIRN